MLFQLDVKCLVLQIQPNLNQVQSVVIMLLLLDGKFQKRKQDIFLMKILFFLSFFLSYSNIVHGSDSEKAAQREIDLWFRAEELANWSLTVNPWIYE